MKVNITPEMANPNRKFKDGLPINEMNNNLFPFLDEIF